MLSGEWTKIRRWLEWGFDGKVVGNVGLKRKRAEGSGRWQWSVAARGNQGGKSGVRGMLRISGVGILADLSAAIGAKWESYQVGSGMNTRWDS